uniref:Uncharacterized protein n=1 Tax=Oryza nivara TaxID=4536 RepID=A0A0E0GQZ9_ORYNI
MWRKQQDERRSLARSRDGWGSAVAEDVLTRMDVAGRTTAPCSLTGWMGIAGGGSGGQGGKVTRRPPLSG